MIERLHVDRGEAWLVMELVQGKSLRDLLAGGALPLKRLLPIAAGIANGLAAAHAAGIVHRDLKPENIMTTKGGAAKILDVGLVEQMPGTDPNAPTEVNVTLAGTSRPFSTMSTSRCTGCPSRSSGS